MGYSSVTTTETHYLHLMSDADYYAAGGAEKALSPTKAIDPA